MKDLITEARELCEKADNAFIKTGGYRLTHPGISVSLYNALPNTLQEDLHKLASLSNRIIPELCDALEKANAEIERLKKRLAYQDDGINPEVAGEFSKCADDIISKLDAIIKGLPDAPDTGNTVSKEGE